MRHSGIRRLLLGAPLHSGAAPHQRIPKVVALAVFSSDALSSVAYATQESMIALSVAGTAAFGLTMGISAVIVALLIILTISYNQTIQAYPSGGGAYIVARDNLGVLASEVAAVALLTDYILTVAVSVSSGIDAVLSAYPHLDSLPVRLGFNVCATLFIMLINLRGVKESGAFFALPTYAFIISLLTLIGIGVWQLLGTGELHHLSGPPIHDYDRVIHTLGVWVVLQAFASGCTALTGVEAISNGIPAFRPPESRNASVTMRWMAVILACMFIGVSYLAQHMAGMNHLITSDSGETVISQIARAVVGKGTFYYVIQWATFLILVLAANTSFADFPRLSAIASRDRHLPGWFSVVGDRLVFQNGIIVLALMAIALELAFKGSTDALIPLYAIGVFIAFTMSQTGMVKHWFKLKSSGWQWRATINGLGATMTAIVAIVFAVVKFSRGAWVVLIIMPMLIILLTRIEHHYRFVRQRLRLSNYRPPLHTRPNCALVLVARLDEGTRAALEYARLTAKSVRALHLGRHAASTAELTREWASYAPDVALEVAGSHVTSWNAALMDELYHLRTEDRTRLYTVVLPNHLDPESEKVGRRPTALLLKWILLHEPGVVAADASCLQLKGKLLRPELASGSNGVRGSHDAEGAVAADETAGSLTIVARPEQRLSAFREDRHTVLLLVPGLHRGVVEAIEYARQLGKHVRALHIELEPDRTEELRAGWDQWAHEIPLIVIESPYRRLREPLLRYIEVTRQQQGTDVLTVVVPEFVARSWWDKALHNQSGLLLKFALRNQPNVVVVNTRYFLDR